MHTLVISGHRTRSILSWFSDKKNLHSINMRHKLHLCFLSPIHLLLLQPLKIDLTRLWFYFTYSCFYHRFDSPTFPQEQSSFVVSFRCVLSFSQRYLRQVSFFNVLVEWNPLSFSSSALYGDMVMISLNQF